MRRDQVTESVTGFISAHAEFEMSVGHPAGAGQGSGGGLGLKLWREMEIGELAARPWLLLLWM